MNILYFTSTFHPVIGGAETYALNLALGLGKLGNFVRIITDQVEGSLDFEQLSETVNINRLHRYRKNFISPDKILWEEMQFGLCAEIYEIINEFQPDLILSNSLDLCVLSKLSSIHTGKPWIATFHEQSPEREALGIARLKLCYEILAPNAVIAGSRFYFERAQKFGPKNNNFLIYHGIDTEIFKFLNTSVDVRKHYNIPDDYKILVSAGRLKSRKGFPDVIKALHLLKQNGHKIYLIIAGSLNSASLDHLSELTRLVTTLDLEKEVIFDNKISYNKMPWLLSSSDIVVQASLEEGLGLSVIEAMSCARPVVTTMIPGIMEIITTENIAMLVNPQKPTEIAQSIEKLLVNTEFARKIGENARKHITQNFSIENMTKQTEEIFSQFIK